MEVGHCFVAAQMLPVPKLLVRMQLASVCSVLMQSAGSGGEAAISSRFGHQGRLRRMTSVCTNIVEYSQSDKELCI